MLRRRLVMSSSSDEEAEPTIRNQQAQFHSQPRTLSDAPMSISPGSNPNPNPNPNQTLNGFSDQPLQISDDDGEDGDFIDVSDHLSPPLPESISSDDLPPPTESPGGCPISEFLRARGLRLRREWISSCIHGLEQSVPGFDDLDVGVKAKLCFEKFLVSDMNFSGGGVLPPDLDSLHLVDLPGPFVLQVDEIVNISCPLKGRYQKAPPGVKRCLKLSLTDGFRRAFGMEYRPIKDLDALAPAGLKVIICNVHIRHGLLMLVPEAIEVLGGLVEELEAARQRLVEEVNKPPRGIRSRNRVVPPLRDRATLAAWNVDHVAEGNNDTMPEYTTPPQVHPQGGTTHVVFGNDADRRIEEKFPGSISEESAIRNPSSNAVRMSVEELPVHGDEERAIPNLLAEAVMGSAEATLGAEDYDVHMYTVPDSVANDVPYSSSGIASIVEKTEMDTIATSARNPISKPSLNTVQNNEEMPNPISCPSFSNIPNDDEVLEVEHPLMLSGSRELPFTYMASLSAKWTSMKESTDSVKGIIKCFLTGVKGFQFKHRLTYDLQVYVDDGSLICEILIHHDKMVGFTPQEVTAAVTSSDSARSNKMRETMKHFQSYLVNFEGKMLVEMNKTCCLPVALEMNPGCSESDAWLLLRRVKSSVQAQKQPCASKDPIYLSP